MRTLNLEPIKHGRRFLSFFLALCMIFTSSQSQAGLGRTALQTAVCLGLLVGAAATVVPDSVPRSLHNNQTDSSVSASELAPQNSLGRVFIGRVTSDVSKTLQISFGLAKKTYYVTLGEMNLAYTGVRNLVSENDTVVQVDTYQNADGVSVLDMHLATARKKATETNQEIANIEWSTTMLAAARDSSREVFSRAVSNVLLTGQRVLLVMNTATGLEEDKGKDQAARYALIETLARYLSVTAGLLALTLTLRKIENVTRRDILVYEPAKHALLLVGVPILVPAYPLVLLSLALTNPAPSTSSSSGSGYSSGDGLSALGGAAMIFSYLRNGH